MRQWRESEPQSTSYAPRSTELNTRQERGGRRKRVEAGVGVSLSLLAIHAVGARAAAGQNMKGK